MAIFESPSLSFTVAVEFDVAFLLRPKLANEDALFVSF
jgi:hypothetical protein